MAPHLASIEIGKAPNDSYIAALDLHLTFLTTYCTNTYSPDADWWGKKGQLGTKVIKKSTWSHGVATSHTSRSKQEDN